MSLKRNLHRTSLITYLFFIVLLSNKLWSSQLINIYDDSIDNNYSPETNNDPEFQSLPQNFEYNGITCILKDYKGYMWFGTGDGLIRYDGNNLYVYESDPYDSTSLSHYSINTLFEDNDSNLWIGTVSGLHLYNRKKDDFINIGHINTNLNRFVNSYISALCMDNQSLLWVGTIGDGINVYNTNNQTVRNYPYNIYDLDGISSYRINCITIDKDNNIWIGTQNGLNLFSDKIDGFKHFYYEQGNPESLSNNHIICLIVDREGNLWIGTKDGSINKLIKKDNSFLFKRYNINTKEGSLSNNSILSLCADKRNNLWIGTENGGLYQMNINTNNLKVFQVKEGYLYSLNSNSIWSLYSDYEGRLWIGTYNKGINVIDNEFNKFESYQKNAFDKNSLPDNDIKGFTEDKKGNIWIATDGGGICKFDPINHQFNRIIANSDQYKILANNAIQNILYDSNNNLWVGTWGGGIDRFDMNGIKIKNYKVECEDGGGNNNVFEMYEDSDGNIWVGTAGSGLYQYSAINDTFNQIICENQSGILTRDTYVTAMLEDSKRCFWVGTLYGMVILKRNPDQKYTCINLSQIDYPSLSSNMINVIFEDSKKQLWFGTGDNGLNLFNRQDSTFTVFQNKDGLPSNSIRGILEDDNRFLWIMTNKGLSKFNYDSLSFRNYTSEDGLNSNEFYRRSCLRAKNGEFYLGGENGFNVFYPQNIKKNTFIPPVCLTNLKINNIQAEIGAKDSPLKKHIGETTEITLNHKQSSFTIEFVALNYTRPARNQFSYKLEGFDNDWNYIGNNRSASYTNIKPGKYIFMVKGSNNDGVWNNHPTELKITIKPTIWKSWWAIIIYIILLSVLTIISLKIWNERIKIKNQLKLEQLAREKEHELNELNIKFFTNIAHEFRTPLSLIIAPLESLINSVRENIKEKLMVIYRNAERLLQLTNNLMDIRKLEDGNTKLKVQNRDILSFIKDVSSFFYMNSKSHNIDFKIESAENSIPGWFDPEKLETILLNLLSNAFKFTSDNGKITVTANVFNTSEIEKKYYKHIEKTDIDSKYIEIKISDTGTGILPEELPYIFDKFYQAKSSGIKKKSGTGIGLTLTKSLIDMHHGKIWVESIPEKDTCFAFILPVDLNAYNEDEIVFEPKDVLKSERIDNVDQIPALVDMENLPETNFDEEKPEILIVEDNDELRLFLANELGKKYKITQAENGKTGVDLALSEIPDLIVSDILMPEYTGIDLCKTIKSDVRTSHIPVILLTAKTTINEQIEGIKTGADAYITKPFNVQFLFAKINQLIQSRRKLYAHFSQDVYIMPNKMTDNEIDQLFIQKAIDYIILNISDNNLNVEGLAVAMNMSRSNVYRKIKALTGKTIIEFIRIIRLKQAIKLMETNKFTLAEIAYQTGFTSPAYFTKSFKNQYGKPPSDYLAEKI